MTKTFFDPQASWNRPASSLGIDSSSAVADWPKRLLTYGGGPDPTAQRFYLLRRNFSVPIYNAAFKTTTAKCFQKGWVQSQQTFGNMPIGTIIPWSPAWIPAPGSDKNMCIVDYQTGVAWYLWCVDTNVGDCFDWFGPNFWAGLHTYYNGTKLSLGTLNKQPNIWTAKDGSTVSARGMGIDKAALTLRAEEVASGRVGHALALVTSNPATSPMTYRKPATKLEHAAGVPTGPDGSNVMPANQTLPSGARFVLMRDRAWVENWANKKFGVGTTLARSMTTIGMAVVEYGAIIAETGKWGIGIETDSVVDPVSSAVWRTLGLPDDGSGTPGMNLLDGLFDDPAYVAVVREPA